MFDLKVKIFQAENAEDLENQINDFIRKDDVVVEDIQYKSYWAPKIINKDGTLAKAVIIHTAMLKYYSQD